MSLECMILMSLTPVGGERGEEGTPGTSDREALEPAIVPVMTIDDEEVPGTLTGDRTLC